MTYCAVLGPLLQPLLRGGAPPLPDRIYASPSDANLFEFHDITSIVRGEAIAAAGRAGP